MDSVKHGWRTVMTGAVLGLLAAGTASSHVSVVERELRGKAFLNQTSALRGVDHRIALADGGQLVLAASGDTLTLGDRHGRSRAFPLLKTRINASLTLLPSGRVLIWGGSDASGAVQKGGLWFHPDKGEWQAADDLTPTARVGHTATVLGDGRVLFAGGLDRRPAELWDERVNRAVVLSGDAVVQRLGHRAELQNDGGVRISGGHEVGGGSSVNDLAFDPLAGSFAVARTERSANGIARSWPQQGASEVMPDARLSVLFADALRMPDLNGDTISLVGPGGPTRVQVAPVEGGRMVFVQPLQALFPASKYTLMIDKVHTESGRALPLMAVDFTTAALDAQGRPLPIAADADAADSDKRITGTGERCRQGDALLPCREHGIVEDAVWSPGRDNTDNRWRLYGKSIEADTNPRIAHVARLYDLTVVRGRIVRIDQKPVADVEVSVGRSVARTDQDGRFNLFDVPAGHQELYVDGSTANRGADEYGQFVVGVQVKARQLNELPYLMHLPKIAARDKIRIASPLRKDLVVGHPDIPGLELHIPKGTVIHDRKGRLVTELAIVPTPVNRAPFPVMENHPMAFTVEPGAAQIRGLSPTARNGIRVYYPNYDRYGAGAEANFWIYDPTEGWRVYGKGTVSADGRHVVPESGVALHQTMGGMFSVPGDNRATERYAADQCGKCNGTSQPGSGKPATAGDPIDLKTGEFLHSEADIAIADIVPLIVERSYRPNDLQKHEFGIGTSWNWGYTLNRPGSDYNVLELIQPNGTAVRFDRVSGSGNQGEWRQTGSNTQFGGAILRTVYDSDPTQPWGRAFRIHMSDGSQLQFSSWNDIRLRWIEDRYGNRTTLVYDAGLVRRIVSPSGRYINFEYDPYNRILAIVDHSGRRWSYVYDGNGLLKDVVYPDNKAKHYAYQVRLQSGDVKHHRIESMTDRRGKRVLLNEFEIVNGLSTGRVIKQTLADNSRIHIDYDHVDNGVNGTLVTEADGSKHRYVFDTNSPYLLSETLGYGTQLAQTYVYERNTYGNLIATIDPLSRRTQNDYDGEGRIEKITALKGTPKERSVRMGYTADGKLATVTDPLNRVIRYDYTGPCLTKVTNALGKSATFACNSAGQLQSVTTPLGHTTTLIYDGYELSKVTDALGRSVSYQYDVLGRTISSRDMEGNIIRTQYTILGQPEKIFDAFGRQIRAYEYDDNGNLLAVQIVNGNGVTYTYDERDRLKTRTDALTLVERWTYDLGGRIETFTDRKSQTTVFTYDVLSRPSIVTYHDGSTAAATYDAGNRLRTLVDSQAGTLGWIYDDYDQLTSSTSTQGSISYGYDEVGRRNEMAVAGQPKTEYIYDDGDRLRRIMQGSEVVELDYDDGDRTIKIELPNGVKAGYAYNDASQLTGIAWLKPDNTLLGDLGYSYDPLGRLAAQTGSFASQVLANVSLGPNTFDDGNHQTQRQGQTQTYDLNGNLIHDGVHTYVWNARNQLTEIRQGANINSRFAYDGAGRRVSRTEAGQTTTYLYDGQDAVQEVQGAHVNPILNGPGVDQRFARNEASGRTYFLADHLGSTRALTDANGAVVQRYDYTAYGEVTQTSAGFTNPYQYTGREKDASGLMYYRARYYLPEAGRFLSEDSYGFGAGDGNFYAYALGNPISNRDPSGHIVWLALIPIVWGIVEIGLSIYDLYDTIKTVVDPCESGGRKLAAVGLFAVGVVLPGGGYSVVDDVVEQGGKRFFRGAMPGEAPHFIPNPSGYKVDKATGHVKPTHGVSLYDNPASVIEKGKVPYEVDQSSIPDTLRIIQRGNDPFHYEIVPKPGADLTPERFAEECGKVRCIL